MNATKDVRRRTNHDADADADAEAHDLAVRMRRAASRDINALVDAALHRADAEGLVDVAWVVDDTPIGPLTLAATPAGVVRIGFGRDERMLDELATEVSPRVVRLAGEKATVQDCVDTSRFRRYDPKNKRWLDQLGGQPDGQRSTLTLDGQGNWKVAESVVAGKCAGG